MFRFLRVLAVVLLLVGTAGAQDSAPKQPVYIFLYSRIADHINIPITQDRLQRVVALVERYRGAHPESGAAATLLFSGVVSDALSTKTTTLDLVRNATQRGIVDVGYDGTNEPTLTRRPVPDFRNAKTAEDRWHARVNAAEKFLSEARHPLTGDAQPGKTGGLKRTQEVFGEVACITGVTEELGGDTEFVHFIGRLNSKAIMFGLPEPSLARHVVGYRGSAQGFGYGLSPAPNTSPELNWMDNVLRTSETSDASARVIFGYEGVEGIKKVLDRMDRKHVRVIHVELANEFMYVRPIDTGGVIYLPIRYAYEHPDRPQMPNWALRDRDELNAAYAKEEELIKWLVEQWFPANPGSRFVSSKDLLRMTPPSAGSSISMLDLRAAAAELLKRWGNNTNPPSYTEVRGRYFSLADMFQLLTSALAERYQRQRFPESITLERVYGPVPMTRNAGPNVGEVTVAEVAKVCAELTKNLNDRTWRPLPANVIPTWIAVNGNRINAAQFLRVMAETLSAPSADTKVKIRLRDMFSGAGEAYPKTRSYEDQGATWTFKPAPLNVEEAAVKAQQ